MSDTPDLRETQEIFWKLIAAPEGVARGAEELLTTGEIQTRDLSFLVTGDGRLDATGRLDIYADMYFYRLRDCLAEDFPRLARLFGQAPFHNFATDYLLAHPPSHFSLRELGRAVPEFATSHASALEHPGAPDLALLEWSRIDVFDDRDETPLRREAVARADPADPEGLRLTLISASRLVDLDASTLALWQSLEESSEDDRPAFSGASRAVHVWRKRERVVHRRVTPDEAACLRFLNDRAASISELADTLMRHVESAPEARLAELLNSWLQAEILTVGS